MSDFESSRQQDIRTVLSEKELMRKVGQEILTLVAHDEEWKRKPNVVSVQQKILEFVEHLSNIGSFCDRGTQNAIHSMTQGLTASSLDSDQIIWLSPLIYDLLATGIGVQIDFNKRPFRMIGIDLKPLEGKIRAVLKRT